MNPRRRNSLAASPLLIGALTVLIAAVAVYVSYGANNGLPFTPTYDIKAELPEASGLEKGNQVRLFGHRIGIVSGITPHQDPATGKVTAIVSLQLEKHAGPLPVDTTMEVQSVSTVGLKYLELKRGSSPQKIPAGATIPVSHASEPVEIQDFFNIFDKRTRIAIQQNTNAFGNGYAGRGVGINNTIHTFRPLTEQRCAGAAQSRLVADRHWPVFRRARQNRQAGLAGRRDAGVAVPRARHLLHRLRRRLALAGTGDRRGPGGIAPGDPLVPVRAAIPRKAPPNSCDCCGRARRS